MPVRPPLRSLTATVTALLVATTGALALTTPDAGAATRTMPGNFTGYAIDTCDAPSQRAMNAWRRHSKYAGIGIYVAGMNRACSSQPNLTRRWVKTQSSRGWRLLPLVVGRQASCSPRGYYRGKRISAKPARDYARARKQGTKAARSGAKAVRRLGIGRGSVVWFDLEHFDLSNRRCRASAMAFTSAWTRQLHRQKFRAGLYSSAASGIRMVDAERASASRRRAVPDYIWVAEWNLDDTLRSAYISKRGWWPNRRVHQYRGGHIERHGGVALAVDSNVLRTGKGTRPGKRGPSCGVRLGFGHYGRAERGDRGRKVRAAQCLLKQRKDFGGKPSGRFGKGTAKAVRRFQRDADVRVTGDLTRSTWTALLARGASGGKPLVKVGSGGNGVRRVQRALNAATGASLKVDGVFGVRDMAAVRQYQRRTHRPRTGVVAGATWRALRKGVTVGHWKRGGHKVATSQVPRAWLPVPYGSGAASPDWERDRDGPGPGPPSRLRVPTACRLATRRDVRHFAPLRGTGVTCGAYGDSRLTRRSPCLRPCHPPVSSYRSSPGWPCSCRC